MRLSDALTGATIGCGVPQRGHTTAVESMTSRQEKQTLALGTVGVVIVESNVNDPSAWNGTKNHE